MTTNKIRSLQQDARAWAAFTGTKYTSALRQMNSPLAQGLLGERVSARRLIAVLEDHEVIGARGGRPVLGENGFHADGWRFDGETDYIQLALVADLLRLFTPIARSVEPEVHSYALKHTAEWFLAPHCSYVSNGRAIWAAAALGLPIAVIDKGDPNLLIGISEREHDYVRRVIGHGYSEPQAHHFRPAGLDYLRAALERAASGELIEDGWVAPTPVNEAAPFHDWLVLQDTQSGWVGRFARDYAAGIRDSDHGVAHTPDELLVILQGVSRSDDAYDAAVRLIAEWMTTSPLAEPIRTEQIGGDKSDHEGWGAGAGTTERYEFLCPCGYGRIIEEHDNIPGFRDHDVWIECQKCRAEWRFADGRGVRDWGLEPLVTVGAS